MFFFDILQIERKKSFNSVVCTNKICNFGLLNNSLTIMKGQVKWFDDKRGYGFITSEEGVDTYVHFTAIVTDGYRTLKHNWRVEYDVVTTDDGRQEARNVVVKR